MSGNWDFKKIINAIAFWTIVFAAIALMVGYFAPSLQKFIMPISSFFAFLVASVSAFYFAKSKRNAIWFILFFASTAVVLVMLFLTMIGK